MNTTCPEPQRLSDYHGLTIDVSPSGKKSVPYMKAMDRYQILSSPTRAKFVTAIFKPSELWVKKRKSDGKIRIKGDRLRANLKHLYWTRILQEFTKPGAKRIIAEYKNSTALFVWLRNCPGNYPFSSEDKRNRYYRGPTNESAFTSDDFIEALGLSPEWKQKTLIDCQAFLDTEGVFYQPIPPSIRKKRKPKTDTNANSKVSEWTV